MPSWIRTASLALAVSLAATVSVGATPTPIPGGANQVQAVPATLGQTVFNGVLRVKVLALRPATDAEVAAAGGASPDKKAMYMETLLNNGAKEEFTDLIKYTLADNDAVAVQIPDYLIKHINPSILQGAALKQSAVFMVDSDFTPVKLVITCATCGSHSPFRAIRVKLTP